MEGFIPFDMVVGLVRYHLYLATTRHGLERMSTGAIADAIGGGVTAVFVRTALTHLKELKHVSVTYSKVTTARLLPLGIRHVEEQLRNTNSTVSAYHNQGLSALSEKIIGRPGVPASNRIVPLNHNDSEYELISAGLKGLHDDLIGNNRLNSDEKSRLLSCMEAAQALWAANELKVVQIKVGVLLAVEDAAAALSMLGKAAAFALLIDAIKAFVKTHTGLDIDKL